MHAVERFSLLQHLKGFPERAPPLGRTNQMQHRLQFLRMRTPPRLGLSFGALRVSPLRIVLNQRTKNTRIRVRRTRPRQQRPAIETGRQFASADQFAQLLLGLHSEALQLSIR